MQFNEFMLKLKNHFTQLTKDIDVLFEVEVDKDELWNLYLDSFPKGTNQIYRKRREFDCSCCRHFIKSLGNVVAIKNNQIKTIWDFDTGSPDQFQPVVDALNNYVKSKRITNVFITKELKFGAAYSIENKDNKCIRYNHFHLTLPNKFQYKGYDTIDTVKGNYRATKEVFKRSLEELNMDSIDTVLELIAQNSLYKGKEWEESLNKFKKLKSDYEHISSDKEKDIFCWHQSLKVGNSIGRIRNHSIGTLLTNITEGMNLDEAVRKYEQIVAPENYKRSKPIFTKRMLENAKKKIQKLGYMESLKRRFANIDDITVNNILFANKDSVNRNQDLDVFGELEKEVAVNPKKFDKVEEINIQDFIDNVLPTAKELEVLFENRLSRNLCSLIAPTIKESKTMFKWNNNFCWAYTGNITDSSMKENVKKVGGKVDGILRFSIQWNDDNEPNYCDYDAHCLEPNGKHIYFHNKRDVETTGMLDVDVIYPEEGIPAVENITWVDKSKMKKGNYSFFVNCFRACSGNKGFSAEIEYNGQIYQFVYNKPLKQNENVEVATVYFNGQTFTIKELLSSTTSSKKIWNLQSNQFIPVSVVMYSLNYWDEQGVGNKHYMFMLKDCVNPEEPNGFYNEFLNYELNEHRKVMEALGQKLSVVSAEDQLSGLGFSSTRRNELIVKVKGNIERILKIKF